jgi:hypothetical protein
MKTAAPTAAPSNLTKNLSTLEKTWPRTLALAGMVVLCLVPLLDVPVVRSSGGDQNEKRVTTKAADRPAPSTCRGTTSF